LRLQERARAAPRGRPGEPRYPRPGTLSGAKRARCTRDAGPALARRAPAEELAGACRLPYPVRPAAHQGAAMFVRIDHVMICVPELEAGIAQYRKLGFNVHPGGIHPGKGTHNAIGFNREDYLELLALHDRAQYEQVPPE